MKIIVTTRIINGISFLDIGWRDFLEGLGHTVMAQHHVGYMLEGDMLVLSGGNDIIGYNGKDNCVPYRDQFEHELFMHWLAQGKPILGICRGALLINMWYGGTISKCNGHDKVEHNVKFELGGVHKVNSHHRHCIDILGRSLVPTAVDQSGKVESFSHTSIPIHGIMWHPERQDTPVVPRPLKDLLFE